MLVVGAAACKSGGLDGFPMGVHFCQGHILLYVIQRSHIASCAAVAHQQYLLQGKSSLGKTHKTQ